MPTENFDQFSHAVVPGGFLGIDPGKKRVGVAVCDAQRNLALPVEVVARKKLADDLARLQLIAQPRQISGWVVGLPLNMDGSAGPAAQSARAFARQICNYFGQPLLLWDERLSSAEAQRSLIAQNMRRSRRAQLLDAHAAATILQSVCDRISQQETEKKKIPSGSLVHLSFEKGRSG